MASTNVTNLGRFAARDAFIVASAALAWLGLAEFSAGSGPLGDLSGLVAGLLVGASAFVLHEWGHLLAALAARAHVRANPTLRSTFLFSFDAEENSLRQFLIMSVGGFAVSGAFLWLAYAVLPDGLLATRVARGAVLFLASLTVLLEFPLVALAIYRGGTPIEAAVRLPQS